MSESSARKLTVLYGSQTGNAQDVAERVWRESKRFRFTGTVKAMDDYNIADLITEKCVVFVCSTTGQGDEPDNMKHFWKFLLRRNLPLNLLGNLRCAVLGLGDSSYVKYNFVAKRLNKRLQQLGADIFLPLALGDDQHDLGYDAVVDSWLKSLWDKILEIYPLPDGQLPISNADSVIKLRWKVNVVINNSSVNNEVNRENIYFSERIKIPDSQFCVQLQSNLPTTSDSHFQDVRLLKFSTQGQEYGPGDVLNVRPKNSKGQIVEFYNILELNGVFLKPETLFQLGETDPDMPVPSFLKDPIKFQTLCEEYFDLSAVPRRYVFSVLAQLTSSELEREKCVEFTSAEGQNELYNYCNRPKRNITEVLRDFPHAVENITPDMLFEIFTPIKSRAFSIASSCKEHANEIHILVAVVKYKTKLVKERLGLCSNWLTNLSVGEKVPVWITKGSFRFPKEEGSAVIMVGPGTGVAPFRSFICESDHLKKASGKNLILIFGCRNRNHDFHCRDDFERLQKDGKLTLICAFSRDQSHKIYVQHKIEEYGEMLWKCLRDTKTHIFVAGNSKNMPQSVRDAFKNLFQAFQGCGEEEAENLVAAMEKNGRYQTETWA